MATLYASTQNTGNLIDFIKNIPSRGVPDKINQPYLISLGYKSPNDRPIPTVLRFINVTDSSGIPTENFKKLRNRQQMSNILGHLIKESYSDLFKVYPDANSKDNETLKNYFASKTDVGEASLRNIVQTFQALCSIATFDGVQSGEENQGYSHEHHKEKHLPSRQTITKGNFDADVHFNIQVHIPGEQKPEVYEAIFKNLGKYVLGVKED